MAPASGFYTTPGAGRNEVRIAYVLKKEDLTRALFVLQKALEAYPGKRWRLRSNRMNLPLFIAHRIYRDNDSGRQVSRPAVLIAMTGIAIGLAVMIVAVSVIVGFKKEVRDKIAGFGAHIQITNLDAGRSYETLPAAVAAGHSGVLDYRSEQCTRRSHEWY